MKLFGIVGLSFLLSTSSPLFCFVHVNGLASLQSVANNIITHYTWDTRKGNYYVNSSEFQQFLYIWR